jgi:hypothetical protein
MLLKNLVCVGSRIEIESENACLTNPRLPSYHSVHLELCFGASLTKYVPDFAAARDLLAMERGVFPWYHVGASCNRAVEAEDRLAFGVGLAFAALVALFSGARSTVLLIFASVS